jgi:DNA-binding transcriptional LysR family regulator
LTRLYSYHVADYVRDGRLKIVLADAEHPPLPAHLLAPHGRMSVPKVRAFVDFALRACARNSRASQQKQAC